MKSLLKSLVLALGLAAASPALAFNCADWKDRDLNSAYFWKEATRVCVQDKGFSVKDRDDNGMTSLHWAAVKSPNVDIINFLIEAGADVNARDAEGRTPLYVAAGFNSNPDVITALIKGGADVNARGQFGDTPLHGAAWFNAYPEVITVLIEAGADGSIEDDDGNTPFDYAKENRDLINTDAYWALNDAQYK